MFRVPNRKLKLNGGFKINTTVHILNRGKKAVQIDEKCFSNAQSKRVFICRPTKEKTAR